MTEKIETINQLKEVLNPQAICVLETMKTVYKNHKSLGEGGKAKTMPNQFGDMAMVADVAAENMILDGVTSYSLESGKVVVFRGEEKGSGVVKKGQIEFWGKEDRTSKETIVDEFWVMDGLDGSENYATKTEWPYGTMLAISESANQTYESFTTAAVCMEEEGWIVLATTDSNAKGVYVIDLNNGNVTKLPNFSKERVFSPEELLADNYFPEAKELIKNRPELGERRTGSTAASLVSILIRQSVTDYQFPRMNEVHRALVDVTRKGNLEQPAVYLMMKLLGGDVLNIDGQSIGCEPFCDWGQSERVPIYPMTDPSQHTQLIEFLDHKANR